MPLAAASGHLPDPALVVLVGPSGAGKSTWASARYRAPEIVSSDELRARVGSGPADLDASAEAFGLLDRIVAARVRRRLPTVVDTLGLDADRRHAYLALARSAGLPGLAVLFTTLPAVCRARNAARDRPVPAAVLTVQLRTSREVAASLEAEGWDVVLRVDGGDPSLAAAAIRVDAVTGAPGATPSPHGGARGGAPTGEADPAGTNAIAPRMPPGGARGGVPTGEADPAGTNAIAPGPGGLLEPGRMSVLLQVSRFPWGEDPVGWLTGVALAAAESGFAGVALMDHLIQIPQVGRPWDPIPEPFVTLGLLAGLGTGLHLGTLVSPVTLRSPGPLAKAVATLDTLTGGRAFCGIGAGWWEREHAAYGVGFASAGQRLDDLTAGIGVIRALWAPGTRAWAADGVRLPETTCYPRPLGAPPIIVGGGGERRTLAIAARLGDACNVASAFDTLDRKITVLHRHCAAVGRDPGDVAVTVLDVPVVGSDRDDTWSRVERLRGRTAAATFAARHHAGTLGEQVARYRALADRGVRAVFVALPDLAGPDDVRRIAPLAAAGW